MKHAVIIDNGTGYVLFTFIYTLSNVSYIILTFCVCVFDKLSDMSA